LRGETPHGESGAGRSGGSVDATVEFPVLAGAPLRRARGGVTAPFPRRESVSSRLNQAVAREARLCRQAAVRLRAALAGEAPRRRTRGSPDSSSPSPYSDPKAAARQPRLPREIDP
jgi:hypothetical protein